MAIGPSACGSRLAACVGACLFAAALSSCSAEAEALKAEVAQLRKDVAALRGEVAALKASTAKAHATETAQAATWASLRGKYKCAGGVLTGITITDGFARFAMGGLEAFTGNAAFPAEVRASNLYVTDPQRGAGVFRIEDGGKRLVPEAAIYAKRCVR